MASVIGLTNSAERGGETMLRWQRLLDLHMVTTRQHNKHRMTHKRRSVGIISTIIGVIIVGRT